MFEPFSVVLEPRQRKGKQGKRRVRNFRKAPQTRGGKRSKSHSDYGYLLFQVVLVSQFLPWLVQHAWTELIQLLPCCGLVLAPLCDGGQDILVRRISHDNADQGVKCRASIGGLLTWRQHLHRTWPVNYSCFLSKFAQNMADE